MAKGQMRSTREKKKPKADKKPEPVAASNFLQPPATGKKPAKT